MYKNEIIVFLSFTGIFYLLFDATTVVIMKDKYK